MRGPDRKTTGKTRALRRSATDAETKLWFAVRDRRLAGFKFVRQKSIGPYVVDFLCRDPKSRRGSGRRPTRRKPKG